MKINGSLIFDASSASEIQNLRVQKYTNFAAIPAYTTADAGRLVYDLAAGVLYFGSSAGWVALATGGNASALQTEVDALETSLGSIVTSSGVFVPGQISINGVPSTATDLQGLLAELAAYATGHDTLAELGDVAIVAAANKDFLMFDGSKWVDHVLVAADLTDVTSTAAELNVLSGIPAGLTSTELGYVDGVTSGIQGQLDGKQPLDAGLTALAALAGTGIVVETADGVFANRTLVAPAAGITIADADGVAGAPTFALANDLAALEGLATTGYVVRTGDGTATTRSLSVTAGDLVITGAADGVATDTTFGLATVTQASSGTFSKVTLDTKGRVIGNTPVTTGDITSLVDTTYVNVAGDTMTGNLVMQTGAKITLTDAPVLGSDAANKAYVDAQTQGLTWKNAVAVATTAPLTLATGFAAGQVIDGVTLVVGDRILVKDQVAAAENGIYVVTAGAPTRALDMDVAAEFDGSAVFVQRGTTNEGTGWTETATVTTVDTDPVAFSQFSGGQAFIWGVGLANTGNTVFINMGAGIAQLPSDEVGLDIVAGKAVQLTGNATGDQLTFVLDGAGLEQSAAGLKISAAGVTNAMLVNSQFTINGDTGTDALVLGDTLQIKGTSVQGISTVVSESPAGTSTFTLTIADASASQKGVATFNAGDFTVTAGDVTIKAGGVDNSQLANSTVTLTGTTGSDAFALGESVAIVGGAGGEVSTDVTANQVAITVRDATSSLKGVASFAAADFTVTAGAVTAVAKSIDSLTDVAVASAAAGQTLVYSTAASAFVNRKVFHTEAVASSTTWVITHGLGQKFCNVTVADATDEVVIPQSIKFDSDTQLTVTFNTAIAGQVMVSGVNPA